MTHITKMSRLVISGPKIVLIAFVNAYRLLLRSWLGNCCRFEPSCSAYSLQALQLHGATAGTYLTLVRLIRCHPWCDGGFDPVAKKFSFLPMLQVLASDSVAQVMHKKSLFSRLVTLVSIFPSKKKTS